MPNNIGLTPVERFSLANQLRIRAALEKNKDDAKYYEREAEILEKGYAWLYGEVFQHIYDELSPQDSDYVVNVMDMFWLMQIGYDHAKDKAGLKEGDVCFPGFDGNNEGKYMGFARFMVQKLGRFASLRLGSDEFNSHSSTTHRYRDMLTRYERPTTTEPMTADEIKKVLGK